MNAHKMRLIAYTDTGSDTHLVVDHDVSKAVVVMTACGRVVEPLLLVEAYYNQISCTRCRSVAKRYKYQI